VEEGSGVEEDEGGGYGSMLKEVTGGQASEGACGGRLDPATMDSVRSMRSPEQAEWQSGLWR
jgi:hypothetical protein